MDSPRFLRLSLAFVAVNGPRVLLQARDLRRTVPRLPDAPQPWAGEVDGPEPLRLVVVGDSTATGVGADSQDQALPGHLGRALRRHTGRGVSWRAVGRNGATTHHIARDHLDEATSEPVDLVFLSVGANDALHARPPLAFRSDLSRLLTGISHRAPKAMVLVSSLPVFGQFGVFPEPLKTVLFRHTRNLERVARPLIERDPRWLMPLGDPPAYGPDFFCEDHFHPSPTGYRDWADWAIDDSWDRGLKRLAG